MANTKLHEPFAVFSDSIRWHCLFTLGHALSAFLNREVVGSTEPQPACSWACTQHKYTVDYGMRRGTEDNMDAVYEK